MAIGTRVTLLTVLLVVLTLSLYGLLSLRSRRAELTADLERQTQLLGTSLRVSLEAALQEGLFEDVRRLVGRMQATEQPIQVAFLDLIHPEEDAVFPGGGEGYRKPPPDPGREERLRLVRIKRVPHGEHVVDAAGKPTYAYMVPLRGQRGELMAVIDLTRPEDDMQEALRASQTDVGLALAGLAVLLALIVRLMVQSSVTRPLLRLVAGIDEVTRGDYTGVLLRESNDEVGRLTDRFNEMTRSLRQAREEILAGMDAKLALENRLRQADKLATIGQLAAGLAHEVGTPLNVIGGRARTMARRSDDPPAVRRNAEIIAEQVERITKIIQQLLDYARRKAPARGPVDLLRVAAQTMEFLEHQLTTHNIRVTLHPFAMVWPQSQRPGAPNSAPGAATLQPGGELSGEVRLPPPSSARVLGDADQLQQVCLNLCVNAIQAMPGGGTLELALCGLLRRKPGLDRTPPGAYVMLAVADTGVGIPEVERERIFEPFYSTKGGGTRGEGGSGLGLSVSAGIVKDHDGWIEIERRPLPEGGTVFRLFFPALDDGGDDQDAGRRVASGARNADDVR